MEQLVDLVLLDYRIQLIHHLDLVLHFLPELVNRRRHLQHRHFRRGCLEILQGRSLQTRHLMQLPHQIHYCRLGRLDFVRQGLVNLLCRRPRHQHLL